MATKVFPHFEGLVLVLEGAVHLEIPAASETGPSTIVLDLFPRLASFLLGYSPRPALIVSVELECLYLPKLLRD